MIEEAQKIDGMVYNEDKWAITFANLGFAVLHRFREYIFIGENQYATVESAGTGLLEAKYYATLDILAAEHLWDKNDEFAAFYFRRRAAQLEEQVARLERKNEALKGKLYYLPGGPGYEAAKVHFESMI